MNSGIAKGAGDMLLDMAFNSSIAVVIFSAGNTYLGLMLILKCWKLKQKYKKEVQNVWIQQ